MGGLVVDDPHLLQSFLIRHRVCLGLVAIGDGDEVIDRSTPCIVLVARLPDEPQCDIESIQNLKGDDKYDTEYMANVNF